MAALAGHPRFKAVIFDWGDVVSRRLVEGLLPELQQRLGVGREGLIRAYIKAAEPYERGAIDQASFVSLFLSALGQEGRIPPEEVLSFPVQAWGEPDPLMVDLVRALHGPYRTALLSNNIPEVVEAVRGKLRLDDLFDVIVLSYEEGVRKPDPAIYTRCLARLRVEPSEAVFVDNYDVMCRGAEAVGIHAVHFTSHDRLVSDLAALGILDPGPR